MRKLKMLLISILIVMGAMLMLNTNQAFAADKILEIQQTRPYSDDNGNGNINDERYDLLRQSKTFHVVKIFETGTNTATPSYPDAIYCLRAGLGFGAAGVTSGQVTYTSVGDMIANRTIVEARYNSILKAHTGNSSFAIGNNYNSILWLIDNMYLPRNANKAELKTNLLANAGISTSTSLTDDDIEVIQQVALWQFTNSDQSGIGDSVYLQSSEDLYSALQINGVNIDSSRKIDINKLFDYLVNTAKTKTVAPTPITEPTVSIKKDSGSGVVSKTLSGTNFYLLGPFEIIGTGDIDKINMVLEGILKYKYGAITDQMDIGNRPVDAFICDINGAKKNKTLQEMINDGVFYLAVNRELYEENISEFKFEIDYSYSYWKTSKADFYVATINENQNQPVVIVDRAKVTRSGNDDITIDISEYDLALRKFITKINGVELTGVNSRIPTVNTTALKNGTSTTATYTHPKNTVEIQTGDKVIYTIRIYNEGDKVGKATEIVDYLPEGLKFINPSQSTVNQAYGWIVDGTGKIVKTTYLASQASIPAFNKTTGVISYVDLQIECEVTARITANDNILRNIAEITNDDGNDRDSVPDNVDIRDYTPGTDNSKYQEDDDDYERLILLGKQYDLALRKYITKINGTVLTGTAQDRVPKLDTSKLENKTKTTAEYNHSKTPIHVKVGDVVKYTIRIYNEGNLDGKALEITDYLPAGLEFIDPSQSTVNQTYGWTANGQKITTDYLKNTTIKAFDSTKTSVGGEVWQKATTGTSGLYYADVEIECRVLNTVNVGDKLTNIAEINKDNSETDNLDRDSVPGNVDSVEGTKPGYKDADINSGKSYIPGQQDDDDFEKLIVDGNQVYDLSLRKFITKISDVKVTTNYDRAPSVNVDGLKNGTASTATYTHPKNKIEVKTGDIVTYTIRVYNEGDVDAKALEVTDYLPNGLKLVDPSKSTINTTYRWTVDSTGRIVKTTYLASQPAIPAFNKTTGVLSYLDLKIECEVVAKEGMAEVNLRNIAEITVDDGADRDSVPDSLKDDLTKFNPSEFVEDDDDYEDLYIPAKTFDLALRKFITKVNSTVLSGENSRVPELDLTNLRNKSTTITDATYNHTKDPVLVRQGDIVTYTIRVYNEGDRDGYAKEITDYLPEGLGLIKDHKTNFNNEWKLPSTLPSSSKVINLVGEDGLYADSSKVKNLRVEDFEGVTDLKDVQIIAGKVPITTNLLQRDSLDDKVNLIKGYNPDSKETDISSGDNWQKTSESGKEDGLYYRDVEVTCIVLAENTYPDIIKNIAEITDDQDKDGDAVEDRDSVPNNVDAKNEDDDDYEQIILKYFDLALRKFITDVNEEKVTTRIPKVTMDEKGQITYTHTKEPVFVANSDVVTYTLRVYNEGTIAGYAEEVKDDIPEGLEFLPDHSTNKQYEWKMYYKDESGMLVETTDSKKATVIKTDYLSEAKETTTRKNKIAALNPQEKVSEVEPLNPDYKDVKVSFKVIEPNTKTDRVIINIAEISEDSGDDEDSIPNNDKDGEDDLDKEYIYVGYFDLELVKYVSKVIVTVNGTTTTTKYTMPKDDPGSEYLVKVVLDKNKINNATVKFAYNIKVTNTGEIEGYATEITDYIPSGLTFEKKDNPLWEKAGTNKVTTRALEKTLLKPGESAEVEIVLTWKRSGENLGIKTNIAEISEDYNEKGSKDIDSTPGNKKAEEDDQDFAKVILERSTGGTFVYIPTIGAVMLILAGGLILIKKYVI